MFFFFFFKFAVLDPVEGLGGREIGLIGRALVHLRVRSMRSGRGRGRGKRRSSELQGIR